MDINKIAQMAGVSRATVSRYLNDGYVSQEKRAAIKRVIDQTGYVPSRQAKTLRTGKTDVVGVIIPKINSASISRMVAGITRVLNDAGYQILLANTDNDASREIGFLRLFTERRQVDGIILMGTVFTPEHQTALKECRVPVVILDQLLAGWPCVHQDDYAATCEIADLVLETSKAPGYIGVLEEDVSAGELRHRGFLDSCAARGVDVAEDAQAVAEFTVDSGYSCAEAIMGARPETDALVCATDSIAYGALTYLREHGIRVPEDVQVTGVGDGELSQIVTPRLTTVHHHYKTSGSEAAKMLLGLMTGTDTVPREIKMGYEIVKRASTR